MPSCSCAHRSRSWLRGSPAKAGNASWPVEAQGECGPALLLNSDACRLVTEALRGRLASSESQRDSALADAEYGDR